MSKIEGLSIESDSIVGKEGGFLAIRRVRLRNRHADESLSEPYVCDFIWRPCGVDAVVVALHHRRADGTIMVLVRDGLRPALALGRKGQAPPIPDARPYLFLTELVAGIIENHDKGEAGVKSRAAIEVLEEAGYRVMPEQVTLLGAGTFPSPGAMVEKYWLTAVEIDDPDAQEPLVGDGSPMEHGATTRWLELDAAIEACVAGDIEDAKTELTLRRLRDSLQG